MAHCHCLPFVHSFLPHSASRCPLRHMKVWHAILPIFLTRGAISLPVEIPPHSTRHRADELSHFLSCPLPSLPAPDITSSSSNCSAPRSPGRTDPGPEVPPCSSPGSPGAFSDHSPQVKSDPHYNTFLLRLLLFISSMCQLYLLMGLGVCCTRLLVHSVLLKAGFSCWSYLPLDL